MCETRAVRLPDPKPGYFPEGFDNDLMSYWQNEHHWVLHLPSHDYANLAAHNVTEHDNGTITVSPSIRVTDGQGGNRHGYLTRGVWEPCSDDRPGRTGENPG